jgi:hypothetical protein
MRSISLRRRIGWSLVAVAFVPFGIASWYMASHGRTALDYRVNLHQGQIRTPEFEAKVNGIYVLYIHIQQGKTDYRRKECLLDLEPPHSERCVAIPNVVDLSWTLWSGDKAVGGDTSQQTWKQGVYSSDYTGREIGRFRARRGARYVLKVNFRRDPSELNIASPKLIAESMPDWNSFAIQIFSFICGLLVALTGTLLLMYCAYRG